MSLSLSDASETPIWSRLFLREDESREAKLKAAGYTDRTEASVFCLFSGFVGLMIGAVFFAIGLNVLRGPEFYDQNVVFGGALGVLLGVVVGIIKVQRGNAEAIETLKDLEWTREMRKVRRPSNRAQ